MRGLSRRTAAPSSQALDRKIERLEGGAGALSRHEARGHARQLVVLRGSLRPRQSSRPPSRTRACRLPRRSSPRSSSACAKPGVRILIADPAFQFRRSCVRSASSTGAQAVTLHPSGHDYVRLFDENVASARGRAEAGRPMTELLLWPLRRGARAHGDTRLVRPARARARRRVRRSVARAGRGARASPSRSSPGTTYSSEAGYWYALAFALGGALLFALAARVRGEHPAGGDHRDRLRRVSASLGVLALDRAPAGRGAHQAAPDRLHPDGHAAGSRDDRGAVRRASVSCTRRSAAQLVEVSFEPQRPRRAGGGYSCGMSSSTARSRSSSPRRCASPACCWSSPTSSCRRRSPALLAAGLARRLARRMGARRRADGGRPLRVVGLGSADRARRS